MPPLWGTHVPSVSKTMESSGEPPMRMMPGPSAAVSVRRAGLDKLISCADELPHFSPKVGSSQRQKSSACRSKAAAEKGERETPAQRHGLTTAGERKSVTPTTSPPTVAVRFVPFHGDGVTVHPDTVALLQPAVAPSSGVGSHTPSVCTSGSGN